MIVDASAICAVALGESYRESMLHALAGPVPKRTSAASYVEAAIVIDGRGDAVVSNQLNTLLTKLGIDIEPMTSSQAMIARQAYRDFGKGSGHKASLNFGDCLSYALAKEKGEPILFVGDDFSHTDLNAVSY